jgi:hypothetical protein
MIFLSMVASIGGLNVPVRRSEPENAEETEAGQAPYGRLSNFL